MPHSEVWIATVAVFSQAGSGPNDALAPGGRPAIERSTGEVRLLRVRRIVVVVRLPRSIARQAGVVDSANGCGVFGCQAGVASVSPAEAVRMVAGHEPSGRIVTIEGAPVPDAAKAIRLPSGDHVGCDPPDVEPVRVVSPAPS